MEVFSILNDIFLKMTWLKEIVGNLLIFIGLESNTTLFGMLEFFIYDVIKIFILLGVLIFVMSYIQSYFPPEKTTKILGKLKGVKGNTIGALLGTVTPFCSCSSIPIFIGFTRAGLPLGVTFSFLISSPLVDLASFLILTGFLGVEIALLYVVVGIILAVIGGLIIDKLGLENELQDFVLNSRSSANLDDLIIVELSFKDRVKYSIDQVKEIVSKVWLYILIGVGIGATIHNIIPSDLVFMLLGNDYFGVLIGSVIGVPMYADIFGTIPIAEALLYKGIGVGTVLAFMMSVTALSLPSMVMLSKVVKKKLLMVFVMIVVTGIILIGLLFNIVL